MEQDQGTEVAKDSTVFDIGDLPLLEELLFWADLIDEAAQRDVVVMVKSGSLFRTAAAEIEQLRTQVSNLHADLVVAKVDSADAWATVEHMQREARRA